MKAEGGGGKLTPCNQKKRGGYSKKKKERTKRKEGELGWGVNGFSDQQGGSAVPHQAIAKGISP